MENINKLKVEMVKLEEAGHMARLRDYRNRCVRMKIVYYDAFKEVIFKEEKEKLDFHANLSRLNLVAFYDKFEDMVETHDRIGIMSQTNGDKYDGQWLDGLKHGHGVYRWADGSCYMGTWSKGLKDGKGTFYPACGNQTRLCHLLESLPSNVDQHDDLSVDDQSCWKEKSSSMSIFEVYLNTSYALSSETTSSKILESIIVRTFSFDGIRSSSSKEFDDNDEGVRTCDPKIFPMQSVVKREYIQVVLIHEVSRINVPPKAVKRGHKWQPNESKRPGEIIYKGHINYDLMLNLQLGIRFVYLFAYSRI